MKQKVLVTGNLGYIGPVMTRLLKQNGMMVIGWDADYYRDCDFFTGHDTVPDQQLSKDVRDATISDLEGVDAIVHLAGLSNDPLGELHPELTDAINADASIRLAALAKTAGIRRFVFASSCSLYGIADTQAPIDEQGRLNPITAYAKAKVKAEQGILALAGDDFHPTMMRNATVYGVSPRLRLDLVVNNLAACGYLAGTIKILSDGTPWRPLVHVEDFCRAYLAVLEAPIERIHNEVFNVGQNAENYQVRQLAEMVADQLPHCDIQIVNQTGPDERSYRVNFSKIQRQLTAFHPAWTVSKGIGELLKLFREQNLTLADFEGDRFFRVRRLRTLIGANKLNNSLYLAT